MCVSVDCIGCWVLVLSWSVSVVCVLAGVCWMRRYVCVVLGGSWVDVCVGPWCEAENGVSSSWGDRILTSFALSLSLSLILSLYFCRSFSLVSNLHRALLYTGLPSSYESSSFYRKEHVWANSLTCIKDLETRPPEVKDHI